MNTAYRWSLGTIVGLPFAILGCLVIATAVWLCVRWRRRAYQDDRPLATFGVVLLSLALISGVAGIGVGMYPYSAEYHQWRQTSGTVQAIDSRLIGSNNSTTQRFVVTLAGIGQRSCDDTRCAQVHKGDVLTLFCKRAWQWVGSPGYDCNYVSDEAAR